MVRSLNEMIPLILLSSLTAWYRTTVSYMQVSAKSIFWLDFGGYKFFHLTWHKSVFGIKIDSQPLADEISSERIPTSPSLLLSKVSLFILSYSMRFYCGYWTWNYFKVFLHILTDLIFMISVLEKLKTGIICEIFDWSCAIKKETRGPVKFKKYIYFTKAN